MSFSRGRWRQIDISIMLIHIFILGTLSAFLKLISYSFGVVIIDGLILLLNNKFGSTVFAKRSVVLFVYSKLSAAVRACCVD